MSTSAYLNLIRSWLTPLYPQDARLRAKKLIELAKRSKSPNFSSQDLTKEQVRTLFQLTRDHLRGVSLQHLEETCFVLEFEGVLAKSSLAPREETIFLIDLLAKKAQQRFKEQKVLRVLEMGCGSSLMLCSFALRLFKYGFSGKLELYGSDLDPALVAVSQKNMRVLEEQLQREGRGEHLRLADLRCGSWWGPWQGDFFQNEEKAFDLVFCNPPYIAKGDVMRVDTAVWLAEPHLALFADGDAGLACYEEICRVACGYLQKEKGLLAFEMGDVQALTMKEQLVNSDFAHIEILSDMEGTERFLLLHKSSCETNPISP